MAYDDLEDRDMGVEDSEMYEDTTLYDRSETFGEQIGEVPEDKQGLDDYETAEEHVAGADSEHSRVEDAFGETLDKDQNPHLANQMEDEKLRDEATADYPMEEE